MKYQPRLSAPSTSDKRFINYKYGGYNTCIAVDSDGHVMPNCVGYAQGRLLEILGQSKVNWSLPACNAEDWYDAAKKNGLQVGHTPKLGAVICWRAGNTHNGADGAGHVAVVEKIKPNGDIIVSNSAWQSTNFYIKTLTKESGYVYSANRPLVGFIYCSIEFEDENVPEPTTYVAGTCVVLNKARCYASESATSSYGTKTGTFYLWDDQVRNGKIRITNASTKVGVAGQVTCWVAVTDLNTSTAYQCIHEVVKGNTLWNLSIRYLGTGSRYTEIVSMNNLTSTNLTVGQKLKIPNR